MEPIKRGVIENWDEMEELWRNIFEDLNIEAKNFNVLLTDSPFSTKKSRSKMAEFFFGTL